MLQSKIHELVAKYTLEPTIRDIFVEGEFDRKIIAWFFRECGMPNVRVLSIDSVDVPSQTVSRYGLTPGNRQEVIALAKELEAHLGSAPKVMCIVDADFDRIRKTLPTGKLLFFTDYTCMEMYLFHEVPLSKFFCVVLGCSDVSHIDKVLQLYGAALRELFLLRAAIQDLGLDCGWVDFTKCCEIHDVGPKVDITEVIKRVLQKGGQYHQRELVYKKIEALRAELQEDFRHSIHGHDFIQFLAWERSHAIKKQGLQNESGVQAALVGCLSYEQLVLEELFRKCALS